MAILFLINVDKNMKINLEQLMDVNFRNCNIIAN